MQLCLVISNAKALPEKVVLDRTPSGNIDKEALIRKIDDLIEKFTKGEDVQGQVQGPFAMEENLPDEVTITQGHTTISEWVWSWIVPGYQPKAIGTATSPLVQHTFKRVNTADGSVPTYGVSTIAPTNTPHVHESSRYLTPSQVMALKKSANQIVQQIQDSPEKIRFA